MLGFEPCAKRRKYTHPHSDDAAIEVFQGGGDLGDWLGADLVSSSLKDDSLVPSISPTPEASATFDHEVAPAFYPMLSDVELSQRTPAEDVVAPSAPASQEALFDGVFDAFDTLDREGLSSLDVAIAEMEASETGVADPVPVPMAASTSDVAPSTDAPFESLFSGRAPSTSPRPGLHETANALSLFSSSLVSPRGIKRAHSPAGVPPVPKHLDPRNLDPDPACTEQVSTLHRHRPRKVTPGPTSHRRHGRLDAANAPSPHSPTSLPPPHTESSTRAAPTESRLPNRPRRSLAAMQAPMARLAKEAAREAHDYGLDFTVADFHLVASHVLAALAALAETAEERAFAPPPSAVVDLRGSDGGNLSGTPEDSRAHLQRCASALLAAAPTRGAESAPVIVFM